MGVGRKCPPHTMKNRFSHVFFIVLNFLMFFQHSHELLFNPFKNYAKLPSTQILLPNQSATQISLTFSPKNMCSNIFVWIYRKAERVRVKMRENFPFFLGRSCARREQVEIERAKEFVGFFREGKLVLSGFVVLSTSTVWLCIRLEDFPQRKTRKS